MPFPTKYREPEVRSLIEKADLQGILASEDYGWVRSYSEAGVFVEVTADEEEGYGFAEAVAKGNISEMMCAEPGCGELNDEFILMFTSGTTSASKGVILKN